MSPEKFWNARQMGPSSVGNHAKNIELCHVVVDSQATTGGLWDRSELFFSRLQ